MPRVPVAAFRRSGRSAGRRLCRVRRRPPRLRPSGHRPSPRAQPRRRRRRHRARRPRRPRPPPPPRRPSRPNRARPRARSGRTRSGSSRSGSRPGRSRWAPMPGHDRGAHGRGRRRTGSSTEFPSEEPAHTVDADARLLDRYGRGDQRGLRRVQAPPAATRTRRSGPTPAGPGWQPSGRRQPAAAPATATSPTSRGRASPGSRPRPMRRGAAAASRPRPSGSTPRAARSRAVYPWGDTFDRGEGQRRRQRPARSRSAAIPTGASWVGALDMSGNAMEWVADWLDTDYYATQPGDATRPARRPARSRSRRAAGGAATSSSRAPPTATTRIRRPTATTTSASGSHRQ